MRHLRLVANQPHAHDLAMKFATMGQRIWYAWHCLPRDERGEPPTLRALERKLELPNATFHKYMWEKAKPERAAFDVLRKMATALNTTPEWLLHEDGDGPVSTFPIVPRPAPPAPKPRKKLAPVQPVSGRRVG